MRYKKMADGGSVAGGIGQGISTIAPFLNFIPGVGQIAAPAAQMVGSMLQMMDTGPMPNLVQAAGAQTMSTAPKTLANGGKIPFVEQDPEMINKDKYNTLLNKKQTKKFDKWVQQENINQGRNILMDKGTYDVQGFWKSKDYKNRDSDGHGTDTWKKPNHPTFSNESKYSGVDGQYGGNWGKNGSFQPSKQTMDLYDPAYYMRLFGSEPNRPEHLDLSRFKNGQNSPTPLTYNNGGQINNTQKVESGLLKFKGPTHANGGIPFEGVEVEGEETNWKNYIFSDRLKYRHVK